MSFCTTLDLQGFERSPIFGIPEYWIADYAALGGIHYIGHPNQPTLSICLLKGNLYQVQRLQGDQPIGSPTFPGLNLTVAQVLRLIPGNRLRRKK